MTKYSNNPVIDIIPDGYTKHVRDPKVWKHNDIYYMLLGAQRKNKTGTLLLYKSKTYTIGISKVKLQQI